MRSVPAPEFGVEQQQHGIELQSACQHVEHEDDLGGQGHVSEVGGGADGGQAGADVVQGSCDRGKYRLQALSLVKKRDQQNGGAEDHDIDAHVHNYGADSFALN